MYLSGKHYLKNIFVYNVYIYIYTRLVRLRDKVDKKKKIHNRISARDRRLYNNILKYHKRRVHINIPTCFFFNVIFDINMNISGIIHADYRRIVFNKTFYDYYRHNIIIYLINTKKKM